MCERPSSSRLMLIPPPLYYYDTHIKESNEKKYIHATTLRSVYIPSVTLISIDCSSFASVTRLSLSARLCGYHLFSDTEELTLSAARVPQPNSPLLAFRLIANKRTETIFTCVTRAAHQREQSKDAEFNQLRV